MCHSGFFPSSRAVPDYDGIGIPRVPVLSSLRNVFVFRTPGLKKAMNVIKFSLPFEGNIERGFCSISVLCTLRLWSAVVLGFIKRENWDSLWGAAERTGIVQSGEGSGETLSVSTTA